VRLGALKLIGLAHAEISVLLHYHLSDRSGERGLEKKMKENKYGRDMSDRIGSNAQRNCRVQGINESLQNSLATLPPVGTSRPQTQGV
jgi:hypothetical protein